MSRIGRDMTTLRILGVIIETNNGIIVEISTGDDI